MKLKHLLFAVIVFGFSLRLAYVLIVHFNHPSSIFLPDSVGYDKIAENLYNYGAFSQSSYPDNLHPDSMRTPLYPFFILIFYILQADVFWLLFVQTLISTHSIYLVYKICNQLKLPPLASIIAPVFLALNFNSIFFVNTVLTETIFQWIVIIAVFLYLKNSKKSLALSGLSLGLAFFTRPVVTFLPPMLLVYAALKKQMSKKLIVFLTVFFVFPLSWMFRNKIEFNQWMLSPVVEVNFFYHLVPAIIPISDLEEYQEKKQLAENAQSIKIFTEVTRSFTYQKLKQYWPKALIYIAINPIKILSFPIRSYIDYQFKKQFEWDENSDFVTRIKSSHIVTKMLLCYQLIISAFLLFGIAIGIKHWKKYHLLWVTAFYFIAISSISVPDPRFRLPAEPFLAIIASIGWVYFYERIKKTPSQ